MFILYFVVIVLLPFLVLVWSSLQKFYSAPSWAALEQDVASTPTAPCSTIRSSRTTVWNSLLLALGSATIVMLMSAVICLDRRAHEDSAGAGCSTISPRCRWCFPASCSGSRS